MDKARSEQIKQCGAMLAIASRLYKCGLITDMEHRKLILELQKKYRPVVSFITGTGFAPKKRTTQKKF